MTLRRTPIRRISKKKAAQLTQYTRLRATFMAQRPTCEKCQRRASTECHHRHGRTGSNYLDVTTWAALCGPCHREIHNRPGQARAAGWLK